MYAYKLEDGRYALYNSDPDQVITAEEFEVMLGERKRQQRIQELLTELKTLGVSVEVTSKEEKKIETLSTTDTSQVPVVSGASSIINGDEALAVTKRW